MSPISPSPQINGLISSPNPNEISPISPSPQINGLTSSPNPNEISPSPQINALVSSPNPNEISPSPQINALVSSPNPNEISPSPQINGLVSSLNPNEISPSPQINGFFSSLNPNEISPSPPINGFFSSPNPNEILPISPSPQINDFFSSPNPNEMYPILPSPQINSFFSSPNPNEMYPISPSPQINDFFSSPNPNEMYPISQSPQINDFFSSPNPNEMYPISPSPQINDLVSTLSPNKTLPVSSAQMNGSLLVPGQNENDPESSFQLTNEHMRVAYDIHINHKHLTFLQVQKELSCVTNQPEIQQIDPKSFKDMCQLEFAKIEGEEKFPKPKFPNFFESYKAEATCLSNPNNIQNQHDADSHPLAGPWSATETRFLLQIMLRIDELNLRGPRGGIDWAKVSLHLPGRTGNQCRGRFDYLKSLGLVDSDLFQPLSTSLQFTLNHTPALSAKEELSVYETVSDRIDHHIIVTREDISQIAMDIYYSPESIVRKCLNIKFLKQNLQIFDSEGEVKPEFMENYNKEFQEMLPTAINEPQILMNFYEIKNFCASMEWVSGFMNRFDLVFRCAHYRRRGEIDQSYVDNYIELIATAVAKYGVDRVGNMDETQIRLDNPPRSVIARRGQDGVVVYRSHTNDKEGFTAIGTCTSVKKFPLIIIAKGSKARCTYKFDYENNQSEFFISRSGWAKDDVMIEYLKWFSAQMDHKPCALILDCYTSHREQKVLDEAKKLNIELIFVPACGTGLYQPLDRKIFGIVKAKLRANERIKGLFTNDEDYKNRYALVHESLQEAWDAVSNEALFAAWDIDGLEELANLEFEEDPNDPNWIPQ